MKKLIRLISAVKLDLADSMNKYGSERVKAYVHF